MTRSEVPSAETDGAANLETVILVDLQDRVVGEAEKLKAHREGLLHRAFSVVVFDDRHRILLQRRHVDKYHSGGLWSNTACGHPRPSEILADAAARRLYEEMGIRCELTHQFGFVYRADVDGGLVEYEYDHVFFGRYDGDPTPDEAEVEEWCWSPPSEIASELAEHPDAYTYWFRVLFRRLAASENYRVIGGHSSGESS